MNKKEILETLLKHISSNGLIVAPNIAGSTVILGIHNPKNKNTRITLDETQTLFNSIKTTIDGFSYTFKINEGCILLNPKEQKNRLVIQRKFTTYLKNNFAKVIEHLSSSTVSLPDGIVITVHLSVNDTKLKEYIDNIDSILLSNFTAYNNTIRVLSFYLTYDKLVKALNSNNIAIPDDCY